MLKFEEPVPDISRKILHIDMDAFYASIEVRDNPALQGKPVVIAKHPRLTGGRGIVATCNYEARKFGIHSAMSAQEAYKRCPKAIFIPGRHDHYRAVSQEIRQIFHQYTDLVEPLSLDEAYLDVTQNRLNLPSGTIIGQMIQRDIYQKTHLTSSVGVSYNKFIAKLASDYQKPHGLTVVEPKDAQAFLWAMDIKDFYGVGKKSLPHFHALGIYTGEDLYHTSLDTLMKYFGKMGYSLYFKVRGIHNQPVQVDRERKSVGAENTFSHFLNQEADVLEQLRKLTEKVVRRLGQLELQAHTVTLKIRYESFETYTRQVQSSQPLTQFEQCYALVEGLWHEHGSLEQSVRLLGVSLSNFDDPEFLPIQLDLS